MVFIRFNATEANPNPHINFITALKDRGPEDEALAVKILRALAAQVRPVMKKHGLEINSFEEYEHNPVFLGRNWNNGETVEIVLRRGDGRLYSASQLISVFCHELSHIMHMNHGPDFWKFYRKLHAEVQALQRAKYFGDGFWSNGHVLQDGTQEDRAMEAEDLPEYLCGGAHSQPPPKRSGPRKRRAAQQAGPSSHTGAQTQKKRKAGTRIRGQDTFKGEGKSLNADEDEETRKKLGTGFRKRAGSKRARDERVAAIEARMNRLQGKAPQEAESDEDDYDFPDETDAERRRMMIDVMDDRELASLKTQAQLSDFWGNNGKGKGVRKKKETAEVVDSDATEDDSDNVEETLKKFGLSVEEEDISGGTHPATSTMTEPTQKAESSMPSVEHQEESAATLVKGEWACGSCTFINTKPLGLQCEICGGLRHTE